jgi:hypothetical protein
MSKQVKKSHLKEFREFINDSVIKVKGGYLEQSTQYRKLYSYESLYTYFIKEILTA